jgi:catechol 2,3-dioxygenase-like lactoylglutathione lyase family enzyme
VGIIQNMITSAIPVIAVSDSDRSEDDYCKVLGFQKTFAYRPDPTLRDPCYLGVARDGVCLHLQSFKRERAGMTDAFLWVDDVDQLHCEISARGAIVQLPPTDQTWGTREIGIRDPDGNVLVFATKPPQ